MANSNYLDKILVNELNVKESNLQKFKMQLVSETNKLYPTRRGARDFHQEKFIENYPSVEKMFPRVKQVRVEKQNSDGKKYYVLENKELDFDRAIQQWSTMICKMANGTTKVKSKSSSPKTVSKVDKFKDTLENTFNIDLDYNPTVESEDIKFVSKLKEHGVKSYRKDSDGSLEVHF